MEKYEIYTVRLERGTEYAVMENMDGGFGNPIFKTIELAKQYVEIEQRRDAANKASSEEQAIVDTKQAELDSIEKIEFEDVGGFADSDSPMSRGRILKALNRLVKLNGDILPLKKQIEKLVSEGLDTETCEVDRIKPMSRRAFNRATQAEQDYHEKRILDSGKKTIYYIGGYNLGKTAYSYANYLNQK